MSAPLEEGEVASAERRSWSFPCVSWLDRLRPAPQQELPASVPCRRDQRQTESCAEVGPHSERLAVRASGAWAAKSRPLCGCLRACPRLQGARRRSGLPAAECSALMGVRGAPMLMEWRRSGRLPSVSCSSHAMDLSGRTTMGHGAWCSMWLDRLPPVKAFLMRLVAEKPMTRRSMCCASRYSHTSDLASPCTHRARRSPAQPRLPPCLAFAPGAHFESGTAGFLKALQLLPADVLAALLLGGRFRNLGLSIAFWKLADFCIFSSGLCTATSVSLRRSPSRAGSAQVPPASR